MVSSGDAIMRVRSDTRNADGLRAEVEAEQHADWWKLRRERRDLLGRLRHHGVSNLRVVHRWWQRDLRRQ